MSDWLPSLAELALYTAADAERELGIPAGTVRSWASRERIHAGGIDRSGRPMYYGADLIKVRDDTPEDLTEL